MLMKAEKEVYISHIYIYGPRPAKGGVQWAMVSRVEQKLAVSSLSFSVSLSKGGRVLQEAVITAMPGLFENRGADLYYWEKF